MKYMISALLICGFASACTVRSERTVVEKPVPVAPASAVVVADPPPTTVVYRSN